MSDIGESEPKLCGGFTDPREPDSGDQTTLGKVKEQYVKKTKTNPGKFVAILVRSQVVNGTNYLFKVDIGEETCSHLLVYKPLPCRKQETCLVAFQLHKKMDEELKVFHKEDKNDTRE
ncbi:cystatin-B-like [Rana temporaria]|uniref:cystatin-B-like n=1 Tax=Rana temporaria TaxID=8407 RepID=UPI001AAD5972|nr:cystatin-B-like [Rana temporaria]